LSALVNIGQNKEAVESVGKAIVDVLKAGYEFRAEQETIRAAIEGLSKSLNMNNCFTGCNFQGDFPKESAKE